MLKKPDSDPTATSLKKQPAKLPKKQPAKSPKKRAGGTPRLNTLALSRHRLLPADTKPRRH
jgi:hypothetical protein